MAQTQRTTITATVIISKSYTMDDLLEIASADIHAVHGDEKLRIAKFLADAVHKDLIDDLFESNECTENFHRTIQNVYSDIDRRVLQRADIIGVTTTGLATKISTLRHVNAKVIICEEAGEVLKSHMLSALLRKWLSFAQRSLDLGVYPCEILAIN